MLHGLCIHSFSFDPPLNQDTSTYARTYVCIFVYRKIRNVFEICFCQLYIIIPFIIVFTYCVSSTVIRSGPNVSIWVSTSLHDPCGSVTLLWTSVANSTCGVYSMEVSYPAGKEERHRKVFPQSAASQMDISTHSLDANTEYVVELVVTFDGRVKIKATATATMKVPKCPQSKQPKCYIV